MEVKACAECGNKNPHMLREIVGVFATKVLCTSCEERLLGDDSCVNCGS